MEPRGGLDVAMAMWRVLRRNRQGTFGAVEPAGGRWRGGVRRYYLRDARWAQSTPAFVEQLLSRSQALQFFSHREIPCLHLSLSGADFKVPPTCTCFSSAHLGKDPFTWT